jgi:hypothetical protein
MTWRHWLIFIALAAAGMGCSRTPVQRAESLARSLGGRAVFDGGRLFRLELPRSRVRDGDLVDLVAWVPELEEIDLSSTRVTDEGIATVARWSRLRKMAVSATKISPAALDHLTALSQLTDLYLVSTPIDDAAIPALSKLSRLRKLSVSATQLTPEGVEQLRKSLPGVVVMAEAIAGQSRPRGTKSDRDGS